ncbi:unnamed protein product [Urochloa humidicola]
MGMRSSGSLQRCRWGPLERQWDLPLFNAWSSSGCRQELLPAAAGPSVLLDTSSATHLRATATSYWQPVRPNTRKVRLMIEGTYRLVDMQMSNCKTALSTWIATTLLFKFL